MEEVRFVVGGQELTAPVLTIHRMRRMWPAVQRMGTVSTRLDLATQIAQIISVATGEGENERGDWVGPSGASLSLEDQGLLVEKRLRTTELDSASAVFSELLRMSGMGPAPLGEAQAASPSTETGTQ